jgi:DNA mismatch repair protein MSH6
MVGMDESLGNSSMKYELPDFLDKDLMDGEKRKPSHPKYDLSTVFVPDKFYNKLCFSMKQYWDAKKVNFDKLVALNLCDFYWFYYSDALVVSRILDLKICSMKNGRFFCYQSCKAFRENVSKLLDKGHKIVMIERMTDKMELLERRKNTDKNEDDVKREVCQVLTRGTYIDQNELDYTSRYTICIFEYILKFGVVFIDTTTHEFLIGDFVDDENRTQFRTMLTRTKPVEVVFYNEYISAETLNIIKSLSTKPSITALSIMKPKPYDMIFQDFNRYKKDLPPVIEFMKKSTESDSKKNVADYNDHKHFSGTQAIGLCLEYLEDIMLAETVLAMGEFYVYDSSANQKGTLYLDSQALENLEVLDIGYINMLSETYSLFGIMDHTATQFGKRLFKKWITSPLLDPNQINSRIEAVDDLINNHEIADCFQDKIRKLPDLERMINRVYNLTDRKRLMSHHMEDFALNRLKDFLAFLPELKKVDEIMKLFEKYVHKFKNERLKELCTFRDVDIDSFKSKKSVSIKSKSNGLFPRISHLIEDLEKMVVITDGMVMPAPGISKGIDRVIAKIQGIKVKLDKILEEKRKQFNSDRIH